MASRLPLFPLNTVLVPGLVLPLHVFEPRYRVLVQALSSLPESAPRRFGVVAIRSGSEVGDTPPDLFPVGCAAELREVTAREDGGFDIVVVGETRFRLAGLDPTAGTPYLSGLVEFLPEPDGEGDLSGLVAAVTALFAAYRRELGVEVTDLPDDPRVVSYLLAAAMVLPLPERQSLLEQVTTADRLHDERDLLRRERTLVRAFGTLPATDVTTTVNPN
ncbi:MAG: LON peptidase substrate-binding domain-containing protein [Kineosporiaceae bacterium]